MAGSGRRGGPGPLCLSQGPRLALPLWGSKEPWGAEQSSKRKSLYFLRTNGNKRFLFISWRPLRGAGGSGPGAGVNSLGPGSDCPSSAGGAAFLSAGGGRGAAHKSKLQGELGNLGTGEPENWEPPPAPPAGRWGLG